MHVIQLSSNNTQKILELGPQSNEASSGLNIQNTQHIKKINILFYFFRNWSFFEIGRLLRAQVLDCTRALLRRMDERVAGTDGHVAHPVHTLLRVVVLCELSTVSRAL